MPLTVLSPSLGLIDRVHDLLLAALINGTLTPGERLTQEGVAEKLGVSRQPVSHALQVLKSRGLLIEAGKRGLIVAPVDATQIRHLYQVREALDALSAGLAAARVRGGVLAPAEVRYIEKTLLDGLGLGPDASIGALIQADVAFHSALHRLSGNPVIGDTVADAWPHFMRSMSYVLAESKMRKRVWREHEQILDAVLSGKVAEAEQRARDHAKRAGEETAARLEAMKSEA
jgi:DNA-binding GntR family transcriptional regulator